MTVYIILLIIILSGILVSKKNTRDINIYLLVVFATMLTIVGLRHFSLGNYDTELIYVPKFEKFISMSYRKITEIQGHKDLVFYLIVRWISSFTSNMHVIIFILSIPYLFSIIIYVKGYSKIPWLSFILFLGLGYFGMSFYLLRQVVAMSLTLLSYQFLVKRNFKAFVLVVLLASCFHQTALIFLLAYPLVYIRFSIKQIILVFVGLALSTGSKISIMQRIFSILNLFISDTSRYEHYMTRESGLNYTGFFIQLCVLVCTLFSLGVQKRIDFDKNGKFGERGIRIKSSDYTEIENNELNLQLSLLCLSLFFMALSPIVGEFWRAASYFGIFSITLLPNVVYRFTYKGNRTTVSTVVTVSFCLYFLFFAAKNTNMIPYRFFWM